MSEEAFAREEVIKDFPQKQDQVAEGEILAESLGWQYGTWGLLCLVVAAWALGTGDSPRFRFSVFGVFLALAVAFLSSAASSIWVRHVWLTLRLPPVKGWSEDVSLQRSKAARFQLNTKWGNLLG